MSVSSFGDRDSRRPVVLGIVGGIGAGKSRVARAFESAGVPVFDADASAKTHLDEPGVRREIAEAFGGGVIDAETGRVDRGALAGVVFGDRAALDRLESILHPRVLADQQAFIESKGAAGFGVVVIDAPLLLEAGFGRFCDHILFVEASEGARLSRVKASRGWTDGEFRRREASQWPLERKRSAADFTMGNDRTDTGSIDERIRSILATIDGEKTRRG